MKALLERHEKKGKIMVEVFNDWAIILHVDRSWKVAYPEVVVAVTAFLDANPGKQYSTTILHREIMPDQTDFTSQIKQRLFSALRALSEHELKSYVQLGEPYEYHVKGKQRLGRPKLWQAPKPGTMPTDDGWRIVGKAPKPSEGYGGASAGPIFIDEAPDMPTDEEIMAAVDKGMTDIYIQEILDLKAELADTKTRLDDANSQVEELIIGGQNDVVELCTMLDRARACIAVLGDVKPNAFLDEIDALLTKYSGEDNG